MLTLACVDHGATSARARAATGGVDCRQHLPLQAAYGMFERFAGVPREYDCAARLLAFGLGALIWLRLYDIAFMLRLLFRQTQVCGQEPCLLLGLFRALLGSDS